MPEKKRPSQTGMLRVDPDTFAGLVAAGEKTLLTHKAIATLAIRAWLQAHHPEIAKKFLPKA